MIGSGPITREGWKSLDCIQRSSTTYVATIPPLPAAVKAISWDEIEWIHGVGSLVPWEAAQVLAEIHGVLVSGGRLVLEQPDWNKAKERIEWAFGDPSMGCATHMNRWCYTPEKLTQALRNAGFRSVGLFPAQHHKPERDFRLEACK